MKKCWLVLISGIALVCILSGCVTTQGGGSRSDLPSNATPEERRLQEENNKLNNELVGGQIASVLVRAVGLPVQPQTPERRAWILQRINENNEKLSLIAKNRLENDAMDRPTLENYMVSKGEGNLLGKKGIRIVSLELQPSDPVAGTTVKVLCKYEAYGENSDAAPSAKVYLIYNGNVAAESEGTSQGMLVGRNVLKTDYPIPADQGGGSYELRVSMTHGDSTVECVRPLTVREPASGNR